MADEHIRAPGDPVHPGAPRGAGGNDHVRPGQPRTARPADAPDAEPAAPQRESLLFLRWCAGLLIVLGVGWGLIIPACLLARRWHLPIPWEVFAAVSSVVSLALFLLLERNLWLSRFMGLRVGRDSSPILEAILLWVFGVVGLLFRSTVDPESPQAAAAPVAAGAEGRARGPSAHKDSFREIVETIVFVIVLVLLLKTFVAEAFVIPTGSMATTLLGYHRNVTCPACGYTFPVNASEEGDPQGGGPPDPLVGCTCPNCRRHISVSGD